MRTKTNWTMAEIASDPAAAAEAAAYIADIDAQIKNLQQQSRETRMWLSLADQVSLVHDGIAVGIKLYTHGPSLEWFVCTLGTPFGSPTATITWDKDQHRKGFRVELGQDNKPQWFADLEHAQKAAIDFVTAL